MSKECIHGLGEIHENSIGEKCLYCEIWDMDRNITLGDCIGNCEDEEPELKPCPFCGAEAKVAITLRERLYKVVANHSEDCVFSYMGWWGFYETEDDTIKSWNKRADEVMA